MVTIMVLLGIDEFITFEYLFRTVKFGFMLCQIMCGLKRLLFSQTIGLRTEKGLPFRVYPNTVPLTVLLCIKGLLVSTAVEERTRVFAFVS
jgi:hypothetical protein